MQAIEKKVKSYLTSAMGYAVLMAILGLVLLIFPDASLNIIRWGLSLGLIFIGIWMILTDITRRSVLSMFSGSIGGVLALVMGVVIILYPRILDIIPIILGVWMIVSSTFSLRLTSSLRGTSSSYFASLLTNVITILCGIILIFNPTDSSVALIALLGVIALVYAASMLVDLIIFRRHLSHVAQFVKNSGAIEIKAKEVKKPKGKK